MSESFPILAPFNPLDKKNLGISVADALLASPLTKLAELEKFGGAGVYALYYCGNFAPYGRLVAVNKTRTGVEIPIYVGKAVPKGARKGLNIDQTTTNSTVLFGRLQEHADSIREVSNLRLDDFHCRYLGVDDIWIPLGESMLIEMFQPVWNTCIDGFGIHDPGAGRGSQKKSMWDVLHPGRAFAAKLPKGKYDAQTLRKMIDDHFAHRIGE